jgi:predicted RNA-binding protein with PIN domain
MHQIQSRELSKVARESLEEAREQLLDVIANYNAVVADAIIRYLSFIGCLQFDVVYDILHTSLN